MRNILLVLALAATALAHGDEEMPGMAMPEFNMTDFRMNYDETSFLSLQQDRPLLMLHISLMSLAFIILLPVSVMLSVAKSPLHMPLHLGFLSTVALGLVPGVVYKSRAPDLYPNNVHSKFGWIVVTLLALHFSAQIFETLLGWTLAKPHEAAPAGQEYAAVDIAEERASMDSNNAPSSDSVTLDGYEDGLYGAESHRHYRDHVDNLEKLAMPHSVSIEYRVQQYISTKLQPLSTALSRLPRSLLSSLYLSSAIISSLLNRPMILIGFFQLMTGLITATCTGMGNKVFSMLAHTIKGAVFLWFGVLTFGRVLGAFQNLGWAWNMRPVIPRSRLSCGAKFFSGSMEMVESSLIFFYGITNIFLEHLANPGGAWSAKDLQHVSIAFMYIGGGLCGILYESKAIARLLAGRRSDKKAGKPEAEMSFNPFPGFTVFWTGILMSQHHQATELSTKIHMQWGYLLAFGAVFRAITYTVMYVSPPKSSTPARPMSEVLVSFCLMAGGAVFMVSNEETVDALLYNGIGGMFVMNLSVGFTALAMAWIMVLMAVKGWAVQRRA